MSVLRYIDLSPDGQGSVTVDLTTAVVTLVTRYNYLAQCWTLDILDAQGDAILLGLMLVPGVNLLLPYPQISEVLGSLALVEFNVGDYKRVDVFGTNTRLLWWPPGEEMVLPT